MMRDFALWKRRYKAVNRGHNLKSSRKFRQLRLQSFSLSLSFALVRIPFVLLSLIGAGSTFFQFKRQARSFLSCFFTFTAGLPKVPITNPTMQFRIVNILSIVTYIGCALATPIVPRTFDVGQLGSSPPPPEFGIAQYGSFEQLNLQVNDFNILQVALMLEVHPIEKKILTS